MLKELLASLSKRVLGTANGVTLLMWQSTRREKWKGRQAGTAAYTTALLPYAGADRNGGDLITKLVSCNFKLLASNMATFVYIS